MCKFNGVNGESLSSVPVKRNFKFTKVIRKLNKKLDNKSGENIFYHLSNDIITRDYAASDGTDVNRKKAKSEAGNSVDFICNVIPLNRVENIDYQNEKCIEQRTNPIFIGVIGSLFPSK